MSLFVGKLILYIYNYDLSMGADIIDIVVLLIL